MRAYDARERRFEMADDVRNTDGRSRSRKKPAGAPVMTNRAALRVLKDLASKKTWYMLGNELGFRVEDINKKNYPWPSDFGCNEYCAKFQEYAKSEHTSPYAALIAVRESLIESNAYTPEVKALMDNVRPDSDEAMCEAALRRLMETIIETALPYNKVPKPAQGEAVGGEASQREADEAGTRPAAVAGEARGARGRPSADDAPGAKVAGPGDMAGRHAPAAGETQDWPVQTSPATVIQLAGAVGGTRALLNQGASGMAQASLPCGNHYPSSPSWPSPEAFLLDGRDRLQALRAILPSDVFALVGGAGQAASPLVLIQRLCSDSGLACRAMQRACSGLAASPGVDAAQLFAEMDTAFGAAEQGGGDAGGAHSGMLAPDVSGQSVSAGATTAPGPQNSQLHRYLRQARALFLRYADADAGRALLCCTLLNLLGAQGFARVMTCPATRELFER